MILYPESEGDSNKIYFLIIFLSENKLRIVLVFKGWVISNIFLLPGGFLRVIKSSFIAAKLGPRASSMFVAVAMILLLAGCGEYGHIPLAGNQHTEEKEDSVRVILQWNNVPDAVSYNVYWSRFAGVTKHNGHKIPDAANPITITDLSPNKTYYFVVTTVGDGGESDESKEMAFAGMGASGVVDFKDLFEQSPSLQLPSAVKHEKEPLSQPAPDAAH